jgi:hypothetical protein
MRRSLIAPRVFVLLLLVAAGSASAQTSPPFTISFTQTEYSPLENANPGFKLTHTGTVPANTTIQLAIFKKPAFNIIFSGGVSWVGEGMTVPVAQDDHYYNPGASYYCALYSVNNGGAIGAPKETTVTVIDDEPTPKVSIDDVTVVEGSPGQKRSAVFTVTLSTPLDVFTSIPITVRDQTATKGLDYEWSDQYVYFYPGSQTATFSVTILGDNLPESDETFQVELLPYPPIQPGKAVGYCTIVDDDDVISPPDQRIAKGEKGIINIRLKSPAAVPAQVIFQPSDPDLLDVPNSVTIPAGGSEADVPFTGRKIGAGSIRVTLPPSRGGRTDELFVTVHDGTTLTVDPMQLNLSLGDSANVTARVDPLPAIPLRILVKPAKTGVVSVPDLVTTGTDGRVVIPVRAAALGSTTVNVALLDIDGGASADFGVSVTQGSGPGATSVVPAAGHATGGETVRLNGYNFSDHCAVSFGGVPVIQADTQPGGIAIVLVTPPHAPGGVDISIRCGTRSFLFPNAFSYQDTSMSMWGVIPNFGTTRGGSVVGLNGSNLPYESCTGARFGQTESPLVSARWGTNSISAVTPAHAAGTVAVTLVCGSQTVTLPGAYTYFGGDDPLATWYGQSDLHQGAPFFVYGARFRLDDVFLINGVPMPDMTATDGTYHWFTLPEISGQADLTLRDAAGRTITHSITIDPAPIPAVTKMPDRITLGAEFSVAGTGLRNSLTYMLGPAPLEVITQPVYSSRVGCENCSPTIEFRVPISVSPGTVPFTIADHGNVIVTKSVEVTASGPAVNAVTPRCSALEGGSLVTISGSGFDDGASVQFDTTPSIDVVVKNRFTIIARVPPPFGITQPRITVFNPDGSAATLTNAFSYKSAAEGTCSESPSVGGRHRAAGH